MSRSHRQVGEKVAPAISDFTSADGTVDSAAHNIAAAEWFDRWEPDGEMIVDGNTGRITQYSPPRRLTHCIARAHVTVRRARSSLRSGRPRSRRQPSRSASGDPSDPDEPGERPRLAEASPKAILTFGCLSAEERGAGERS